MSTEGQMNVDERRKYMHKMRIRYWQTQNHKERSKLLDEMEAITELHRMSLLRLIHGDLARKPRRKQRRKSYGAEVKTAVQVIAASLDYPCAERLHPAMVWMAEHLRQHGKLDVSEEVLEKLKQMSVSTLGRLLPRAGHSRLAYHKSQPGASTSLRQARRIRWAEPHPGHFEVDLVHHCGVSSDGQYVHTHPGTQLPGNGRWLPAYLEAAAISCPGTSLGHWQGAELHPDTRSGKLYLSKNKKKANCR